MSAADIAASTTPNGSAARHLQGMGWGLLCVGGIASAIFVPYASEVLCGLLAIVILAAPPGMALGALALAAWIKARNPYLVLDHFNLVAVGWLPILAAILRAALQPASTLHSRGVLWIMAFAALAGGSVLATPTLLAVSIPKLLVFSAGLIAMLALASAANLPHEISRAVPGHDVVNGLYLTVTCLCAPLLAIPEFGFLRNQTGFQGVTSQPQAFAVLYAPLVAYYVMRTIETGSLGMLRWCAALAGVTMLVWSQSRTGVAAALAGIGLGLLVWWRGKAARGFGPGFWLRACGCVIVLAGVGYAFREQILQAVIRFLLKGGTGEFDTDSFLTSRALLLAAGWQSFLAHPLLGIGFGVPTTLNGLEVATSDSFGIVLSVAVEKGNGFLQVLEETGLVGAAVLCGFIAVLARAGGLARNAAAVALVGTALANNIGEAIIYSLGGTGLAQWAYVMLAMTLLQPPQPTKR